MRNLIESKFPQLDFVLVVVGNRPTYAKQWGERKIRNYYLNDTHVWNDVKQWKSIFSDLGILQDDKRPIDSIAEEYVKNLCGQCEYCQRKLAWQN